VRAQKSLLLYDTCESGSMTETRRRGVDLEERMGALNRLARATGRTYLTATTDDSPALEGFRGHGVFTYAVLDAFNNADANGDGLIQVSELADYVDRKVPDFSFEAFSLRQVPQRAMSGSNFTIGNRLQSPIMGPPTEQKVAGASYVITSQVNVFDTVGADKKVIQQLNSGSVISVIQTEGEWLLVARQGRNIGFVMSKSVALIQ
jgi:hypothetical protein